MHNVLKMKEPMNTWTHFIPFISAIIALIVMILKTWNQPAQLITLTIYISSVIFLYGASSFYHWLNVTKAKELILRRIDHIAIYVLIAGSYTPVFYYGLNGVLRWIMLSAVWSLALGGILLKVWFMNAPRKLSTLLYVLLGWIALVPFVQLVKNFPRMAIILMFSGGISYTIGAVIYAAKKPKFLSKNVGFHEVFHIFVALGGVLHFIMMIKYIAPIK